MRLLSRRRPTKAYVKRELMHQERVRAPTLRQLRPSADNVMVDLVFDPDALLVQSPRLFSLYPAAKAHFVYACHFGDCDGSFDLNIVILALLDRRASHTTGKLRCNGRKGRRGAAGCHCELGVQYNVVVKYGDEPATHVMNDHPQGKA